MLSQLGGCQKAARLWRLSARTWRRPGFLMNDTLRVAVARSTAITVSKVPPGGRMGIDDDRWGHLERSCEIFVIYSFLVDISDFGRWDYRKNIWGILEQNGIRILKWRFELRRRFKEYLPSGYLT